MNVIYFCTYGKFKQTALFIVSTSKLIIKNKASTSAYNSLYSEFELIS